MENLFVPKSTWFTTVTHWLSVYKLLVFLIFLYFPLRLSNLTLLPIFNDEAIYLNWGWIETHNDGLLFYSLFDGKQPLLMWIFGVSQNIFQDPLFAGRIVAVGFGFFTLLGIYTASSFLFDKKIAVIASLLYVTNPLFSFFDRQALMESSIAAFGIWSFYFFLKYLDKRNKKYALILGVLLGIGYFVKSSLLLFYFAMIPFFLYLLYKNNVERKRIILHLVLLLVISQIVLIPLYLESAFWRTLHLNTRYVLSFSELLHFPIANWIRNAVDITILLFWYLNPAVFFFIICGFILIRKKHFIVVLYSLLLLFLFPILTRNISPRYIVVYLPIFLIPASYFIFILYSHFKISILLLIVSFTISSYLVFLQLTNPLVYFLTMSKLTPFSQIEEYVTHWPSGYGIPETAVYLQNEAKENPIDVGIRNDSGNPEDGIATYFNMSKTVNILYVDGKLLQPFSDKKGCIKTKRPLFFISRGREMAGLEEYIEKKMKVFQKPYSQEYIGIYKIKTSCS